MKKIMIAIITVCLLNACSIFHKDQYGCPKSSAAIGAEKLVSGDQKAGKLAGKQKFHVETGIIYH